MAFVSTTSTLGRVDKGLLALMAGGTAATPGYFIADVPWTGFKTQTGSRAADQSSAKLGGGQGYSDSGLVNNETTRDHYFDAGTFKCARILPYDTNLGINSTQIDGVTVASQDQYASPATNNNYVETTGIAVTAGLKVVKHISLSKNASSSAYYLPMQSCAFVRTGA